MDVKRVQPVRAAHVNLASISILGTDDRGGNLQGPC